MTVRVAATLCLLGIAWCAAPAGALLLGGPGWALATLAVVSLVLAVLLGWE